IIPQVLQSTSSCSLSSKCSNNAKPLTPRNTQCHGDAGTGSCKCQVPASTSTIP
ncbi:hypothetical protein WG66_003289, partial [Moniliophthora roreri]